MPQVWKINGLRVLPEVEAELLHRAMLKVSGFWTVARLLDQPLPPVEIPTLSGIRHSLVVGCAGCARAQVCRPVNASSLRNRGKPSMLYTTPRPYPPPTVYPAGRRDNTAARQSRQASMPRR